MSRDHINTSTRKAAGFPALGLANQAAHCDLSGVPRNQPGRLPSLDAVLIRSYGGSFLNCLRAVVR